MSTAQIAVYAEALKDLNPEVLEFGCAEASKTMERFPWPGHIRAGAKMYRGAEYLGPPLLEYSPVTDEERAEALEFSEQLKKKLGLDKPAPKPAAEPKKLAIVPALRSLEEQKTELRRKGFLK